MASTSRISPELTDMTAEPIPENDELWQDYKFVAGPNDEHVIKGWNKITDVFLIYITLVSGIIAAFGVDSIHSFQPDPGVVTNQILIAIYKETMNKTHPIDLERFLTFDTKAQKEVNHRNLLLYLSLAFAIIIGALATMSRIWIFRYARKLNHPPPGSHRFHALNRQELYDGSRLWKLGAFIEFLPILTLVDIFLFGLFLLNSIGDQNDTLGFIVTNVFQVGFCYLSVTSFSGAFIPNAPFQSSYSTIVKWSFTIIPNYRYNLVGTRFISVRTIGTILIAVAGMIGTGYLIPRSNPDFLVLIYIPTAAIFALMLKGERIGIRRRINLPFCIFLSVSCVYAIYIPAVLNWAHLKRFIIFFAVGSFVLIVSGIILVIMSRMEPSCTAVNAVAWILKTSPSPKPIWFKKALRIAGNNPTFRARLLELLLPLAEPLVIRVMEDGVQELQEEYLDCLQSLTNSLKPHAVAFWRNEVPIPSRTLMRELKDVTNVECPPKSVGMTNFTHIAIDNYRECPLCYIKHMAQVALDRFDGKTEEMVPKFGQSDERGGDSTVEAITRRGTTLPISVMANRHSQTLRRSEIIADRGGPEVAQREENSAMTNRPSPTLRQSGTIIVERRGDSTGGIGEVAGRQENSAMTNRRPSLQYLRLL